MPGWSAPRWTRQRWTARRRRWSERMTSQPSVRSHCQAASALKTLDRLNVRRNGEAILIEAEARSFLHHQVRSMVGCLALVGLGRWPEGRIAEVLAARDRRQLGLNAPPDGLYFTRAIYPAYQD